MENTVSDVKDPRPMAPPPTPALAGPAPVVPSPGAPSMGVLPKVTGLDYVLWLHRKRGDAMPYVEVTPDIQYSRKAALKFTLEPLIIGPTSKTDGAALCDVIDFLDDNLVTIQDYWDGVITDKHKVIEAFRKPKYNR